MSKAEMAVRSAGDPVLPEICLAECKCGVHSSATFLLHFLGKVVLVVPSK